MRNIQHLERRTGGFDEKRGACCETGVGVLRYGSVMYYTPIWETDPAVG